MENLKQWSKEIWDHNSHNTESSTAATDWGRTEYHLTHLIFLTWWSNPTSPSLLFNEDGDVFLIWWCNRSSGLPWWLSSEESACNAGVSGDAGSISGPERSPGGEHGSPLQCSCLEKPMDRGARWATVHRITQSQTQLKQVSSSSSRQHTQKWRHHFADKDYIVKAMAFPVVMYTKRVGP